MDLGTSLKNARASCGLTQGEAADKIGVSRQTLSNWENNRSYPDIISMIAVSNLYGVQLDTLVREDDAVREKADQQNNQAKNRQCIHKWVQVGVYLSLWLTIILAWLPCSKISGAYVLYGIFVPFAIMPMLVFVFSILVGLDEKWKYEKWTLVPLGFFISVSPLIFIAVTGGGLNDMFLHVEPVHMWLALIASAGGMLLGTGIKFIKRWVIKNIRE